MPIPLVFVAIVTTIEFVSFSQLRSKKVKNQNKKQERAIEYYTYRENRIDIKTYAKSKHK